MEEKPMMQPECTIVVGETGAGKSTWLANFIKNYKRNVIVFKHEINIDDPAFLFLTEKTMSNYQQGVKPGEVIKCKMSGEDEEDWYNFLKWCRVNFRHGMIVLDDSQMFEIDRPTKLFRKFLIMKRHLAMNIFVVYHGLSFIPIEIFGLSQKIILFNTTDNPDYKVKKIPRYKVLVYGIDKVRQNFKSNDKKYTPVIIKLN